MMDITVKSSSFQKKQDENLGVKDNFKWDYLTETSFVNMLPCLWKEKITKY